MRRLYSIAAGCCIVSLIGAANICGNVYAANDTSSPRLADDWPRMVNDWNYSPVDLSFLNKNEIPAGKHGFLHAAGERLVFDDGTLARFWGTNITASALFRTPKDVVKTESKRLSELGFNMVRIQAQDSAWVHPNIFGAKIVPTNTLYPDPNMLEKVDWWIECLEDEGIYVWIDLEDGRQLKQGDNITAFNELPKHHNLRGYNYVNPSIQLAMQRFDKAYLNHTNVYNHRKYKDDPGVAILTISNENDATHHFGNSLLPDKHVPWHTKRYMSMAKAFAASHGLDFNRVWQSWKPGPSKLFLNDLEYRFNVKMISFLRGIGVKIPIVTTSTWGDNPLSSLPALSAGDVIDVHAYGGEGEISKNPLLSANMVDWMAAAKISGKPMSISEWNVSPYPVRDRYNDPVYVAAVACRQGWNIILQFAYSQKPFPSGGHASNWQAYNDPKLVSTFPAAALIFRRGDVHEATRNYVFAPNKKILFDRTISPKNSIALRTAVVKGKLAIALPKVKELPWLAKSAVPDKAKVISNPSVSLVDKHATSSISHNGELIHDWGQGLLSINTPCTQGVLGHDKGKKIRLSDLTLRSADKNCAVIVQSLDRKPIKKSQDILITLATHSSPVLDKPVHVAISLNGQQGLKLFKAKAPFLLFFGTSKPVPIPVHYSNGQYLLHLTANAAVFRLKGTAR